MPLRARRVVNMIRGKQAHEALAILKFNRRVQAPSG
jgi:ribosomal protein L22